MKKVSIVVPVYNVEKYLITCVESLIGQSYNNIEIILVDDGSTDNCPAICDEYARRDSRVKVIHKENGGLSDARNVGLSVISGELLFFVDSDDYINRYCLEIMVDEMENANSDIIECRSNNFTDGNDPSWECKPLVNERKVLTKDEWLTETRLGKFISCAVWNKLYKSELYKDISFPVGRAYEDEATTYKIINKVEKICRIDGELYLYRLRENSIMTGTMTLKKIADRMQAFIERVDFFYENGNKLAENFSRAKLCLAAIGVIEESRKLDQTGKTERELLDVIYNNFEKIKTVKSVPLKYKMFIAFFVVKSKISKKY